MKHRLMALLLAAVLLLSGCGDETGGGTKPLEELFEKTAVSLEEGHVFFTGRVTSVSSEKRTISFYDAETEKSTFYQVEITDDPFGCMPDRDITVCVMGSAENFENRLTLEKNKEYLFDTTLWVQEEAAVFLLPTFYESLPEREGDLLYYTDSSGRAAVDGSYPDYLSRLETLAAENNYGPETVLTAAKERLQGAAERDAAYFEKLEFENVDAGALAKTNQTAASLLEQADQAAENWESIRGLLK